MFAFMNSRGQGLSAIQDDLLNTAWEKTYAGAGKPTGSVDSQQGQQLLSSFQDNLRDRMRTACGGVPSAELFFAVRVAMPHLLAGIGWGSDENRNDPRSNIKYTMGLRRIATHGALIHGAPAPANYSAPYGGAYGTQGAAHVADAFASLLLLSDGFARSWLCNSWLGQGNEMLVDSEGLHFPTGDHGEYLALVTSLDERKRLYYSPFSRIGEFYGKAGSVLDPFEEGRRRLWEDQTLFLTSSYGVDNFGRAAYRLSGWPLGSLETYLDGLPPEAFAEALGGLSGKVFMDLLGGLCLLIAEKLEAPETLLAAHESSVIPIGTSEIEGRPLIEWAAEYSRKQGRSSEPGELEPYRESFLRYLLSNGKASAEDPFLRTSIGDTRYSYPLHRFGQVYVADLYHADHWFHRIVDLLGRGMRRGTQANAAGKRVEDQVWSFFEGSGIIKRVEELRGLVVEQKKGRDADDLDCPLQVGETLVLAEVKGERLHYETEAVERRFVRERWEGNGEGRKGSREYLDKIDDTARKLTEKRKRDDFRGPMTGVKRILPLLCRPYPEWIPETDERYWLRQPSASDPGVPRVLTPAELKNFLFSVTEEAIGALPGGYVVNVSDLQ